MHENETPTNSWSAPIPLKANPRIPNLDLGMTVPTGLGWFRDFLIAVGNEIQVSPAMVFPVALSVVSMALTRAVVFQGRPGYSEVPAIWTLTIAEPGARKSPILKRLLAALSGEFVHGISERRDDRLQIKEAETAESLAEIWAGYDPGIGIGDVTDAIEESQSLLKKLRWNSRDPSGSLTATNTTMAALADALERNGGRFGLFAAEMTAVDTLFGSTFNPSTWLSGWSGEHLAILRKNARVEIDNPQIVVGLLAQPRVLHDLLGDKRAIGSGLMQRFLITTMTETMEAKFLQSIPVPYELDIAWSECVRQLAALPRSTTLYGDDAMGARELSFTEDGLVAYAGWYDQLQQEIGLASSGMEKEWLSKAHGQALRIAGCYSLMEDMHARVIDKGHVTAACRVVEYFHAQLQIALTEPSVDGTMDRARRVLDWVRGQGLRQVPATDVIQGLRGAGAMHTKDWAPVFKLLCDHRYLRPVRLKESGAKGGRPVDGFAVNPSVFLE